VKKKIGRFIAMLFFFHKMHVGNKKQAIGERTISMKKAVYGAGGWICSGPIPPECQDWIILLFRGP
jgi:hypothetical protein